MEFRDLIAGSAALVWPSPSRPSS